MIKRMLPLCIAAAPLWCGAAQAASPIPFKQEAAAGGALPGGAIGVLLSLLAIAAVYWVRKRLNLQGGVAGAGAHLKVLETRRLGPRALLSVVEFGGKQYLLAQTEHGVNCLATAPAEAQPALADAPGAQA